MTDTPATPDRNMVILTGTVAEVIPGKWIDVVVFDATYSIDTEGIDTGAIEPGWTVTVFARIMAVEDSEVRVELIADNLYVLQ